MPTANVAFEDDKIIGDFQEKVLIEYKKDAFKVALRLIHKRNVNALGYEIHEREIFHGQKAFEIINTIRFAIENLIIEEAQEFTSFQWLWYIRRLPTEIFAGSISTTRPYALILAEHLTSKSKNAGKDIPFGTYLFSMNKKTARKIAIFAAMIDVLTSVHADLRCAAKGTTFKFLKGAFPIRQKNDELESSFKIYDMRCIKNNDSYVSVYGMDIFEQQGDDANLLPILARSYDGEKVIKAHQALAKAGGGSEYSDNQEYFLPVNFFLTAAYIDNILEILNDDNRNQLINSDAVVLYIAINLLSIFIIREPLAVINIFRFGYTLNHSAYVKHTIAQYYAEAIEDALSKFGSQNLPTDFDDFLNQLTKSSDEYWPLGIAPVLRWQKKSFAIDFFSLSHRFLMAFDYSKLKGSVANIKGERFELVAQKEIKENGFITNHDIEAIRGRPLRHNGKTITDIDALAVKGNKLLLISCKSILVNNNYISGDYKTIRNVTTSVLDYAEDWQRKTEYFKLNPKGDNYDMSGYEIIGVLCLPNVVYMPHGLGLSMATKGLYYVSSLDEIIRWLKISHINTLSAKLNSIT